MGAPMFNLRLVLALGILGITSAEAMAGPSTISWAGFYIGVNAGEGWTRSTHQISPQGTLVTSPFIGSLGWGQVLSTSDNTFTGGGQVGYNVQSNNIVMGIEADSSLTVQAPLSTPYLLRRPQPSPPVYQAAWIGLGQSARDLVIRLTQIFCSTRPAASPMAMKI